MFRNIFGMLAALIVSTSAASATSEAPLDQRIANAQAKISELGSLAAPSGGNSVTKSRSEGPQLTQHWHNHHHHWPNWNNWANWNNWGNHHHHHHR